MFVGEWTLLISVAFNASRIRAGSQSGLLEFKTAMRVMAVTALHCPFENFVMEGLVKVWLCLGVATHTKLRLTDLEHMQR